PFDPAELEARVAVGAEVVHLRDELAQRVADLEGALAQVKSLQGLLPICAYCKKIRDGDDYWQQVETYVTTRTDAKFSHGICPECLDQVVREEFQVASIDAKGQLN